MTGTVEIGQCFPKGFQIEERYMTGFDVLDRVRMCTPISKMSHAKVSPTQSGTARRYGPNRAPQFDGDISCLGDLSGTQTPPDDEEGKEALRQ